MSKIKLTKGELKRQRDFLKQFQHYLPTLQLKKQQLQIKIHEAKNILERKLSDLREFEGKVRQWAGLLSDPGVDITEWIKPRRIATETINIAGANIPIFKEAKFRGADYDYYETPFWIDEGISQLRLFVSLLAEISVIERQIKILEHELQVTTQRVNLFEKIKIPECTENIRIIRIYLGDQQSNAVGISKVAKKKLEEAFV